MDEEDLAVLEEFVSESHAGLDRISKLLPSLASPNEDPEVANEIFRHMHSIKGTAGFLDLPRIERLAHSSEALLDRVRSKTVAVSPALTAVLTESVRTLRRMLATVEVRHSDDNGDIDPLLASLEDVAEGRVSEGAGGVVPSEAPSASPVSTSPSLRFKPEGDLKIGLLGEMLVTAGVVAEEDVVLALRAQRQGDTRRLGEILVEMGVVTPQEIKAVLDAQGERVDDGGAATAIPIGLSALDALMRTVGDLVLVRNRVSRFADASEEREFVSAANRLGVLTSHLQEWVMKNRTQPISTIWDKFGRSMKSLSEELGKDVHLVVEGGETALDRTVLDALKDPMTHIIRNSIDHGIETPAERVASGKPRTGTLSLRAVHDGGQVHIEVVDDGKGIDAEVVRDKAISKGIITASAAEQASESDILKLIFAPGFSTAAAVTKVSGRGVGMDVVKTNIERIGGTIDLHSQVGQGTRLSITIPLTLAIVPVFMVCARGQRYAVPQSAVVELTRHDGESHAVPIDVAMGAPVYRLRGELLPVVYLSEMLGEGRDLTRTDVSVVVVHADGKRYAIVVDRIEDSAEIVVKPVASHIRRLGVFAGATVLGDGQVSLILDVMGIARRAGLVAEIEERRDVDMGGDGEVAEVNGSRVLVVQASSRRVAVPLDDVLRLEEIESSRIAETGRGMMVQYRGRLLPLIWLSEYLGEPRGRLPDAFKVLVGGPANALVGVVVDHIVDIVGEAVEPTQPGLPGAVVIDGCIAERVALSDVFGRARQVA